MTQLHWHNIAEANIRSDLEGLILKIYRRLGTSYSLSFLPGLPGGNVLTDYPAQPDPRLYESVGKFARDYLAYQLIRKTDLWDVGIDKKLAAMRAFDECERRMKTINESLMTRVLEGGCLPALTLAAQKISSLLGPFCLDDVVQNIALTSGASTRLPRRRGAPGFKLSGTPHCTRETAHLMNLFLYTDEVYMKEKLDAGPVHPKSLSQPVAGARFDLVPKNYKTDRCIAIEPELNMMFQRGVGRTIRKRLLGARIDLTTQSYNQYLALVGSRTGSLCTIDLEAASDSISQKLVEQLLPPDWFEFLELIRSKRVERDGSHIKLEKFSSMGNGFTFELETLLFWGLSSAVCDLSGCHDKRIAVYGDDIIVHNSYAHDLIHVLDIVGFRTNKEKTFLDGPFRESCGKHYFYGKDVTPFNFTSFKGDITDLLLLLNSYNEWAIRVGAPAMKPYGLLNQKFNGAYVPVVPPSYGLRAGIVSRQNPLRVDENGMFRLHYLTYASKRRKVPQFGQYWVSLLSPQEEPLSEVVEPVELVVRKRSKFISVWE